MPNDKLLKQKENVFEEKNVNKKNLDLISNKKHQ